jgi:hypothetical protein
VLISEISVISGEIYFRGRFRLVVKRDVPLSGRRLPGSHAVTAALFDFLRKITHGLLCDDAAMSASQRILRLIDGSENLSARAFTLLPQGKGFPHGILFVLQSPALNGLANNHLLSV